MSERRHPLLMLHGALGSKAQFEEAIQQLQPHFDVHAINFEGHGGRETQKPYVMDGFMQNVLQYLDENGLQSVLIFGYSMGGYVALKTALNHPERIERIVTLGTKFNWDQASTQKELAMLNPEKIKAKVPAFAERLVALHTPLDWVTVVKHTADMMKSLSEGEALDEAQFKAIDIPVVIGRGSADQMVTSTESEQVAEWLPQGSYVELDAVPHPIEKIDTDALVAYICNHVS